MNSFTIIFGTSHSLSHSSVQISLARYSLQFLYRTQCINASGLPCGFAGFIAHIGWTEPSNFFLSYLLSRGVIAAIAGDTRRSKWKRQMSILTLLCYLFEVQPFDPAEAEGDDEDLVLDPLPESVMQAMVDYNRLTMECYFGFYQYCERQQKRREQKTADCQNTAPSLNNNPASVSKKFDAFQQDVELQVKRGQHSLEYCREELGIPLMVLPEQLKRLAFSRYLYNFFVHGQFDRLREEMISFSGAYRLLYSFNQTLKAIYVSLRQSEYEGPEVPIFSDITTRFSENFQRIYY